MARSSIPTEIGQLLIVGFDGAEMTPRLRAQLTRLQPAGVILFARNIATASQTHRLLLDCQACVSTPLFTCVDMEGGRVDRLKHAIAPAPSAADVFATSDRKLFRKHGNLIGESCRAVGFNVDLAPVVDLALEVSRNVMGSRAVSADPKEAIAYAREFLRGLASAGVVGAAKHFPGLGGADLDTHLALPGVARSWAELWAEDLYPYRVMRRELPMVLVGHASYPAVTHDRTPASLAKKWISEVLRKKIGYRGLIVSDDLEMGGVLAAGSIEHVAVEHIAAGGDLCLICHQQDLITRAFEALTRQVEVDRKFARRAKDSIKRVLLFKSKSRTFKRSIAPLDTAKVARLTRQLWEFSEQVRLQGINRKGRA